MRDDVRVIGLLLREVEVGGRRCDVLVRDGLVAAVGPELDAGVAHVVDGAGVALIPGLHDHHCHLLAAAAVATSVDVSGGLDRLRGAPARDGWIRAVGYDDARHGPLDRAVLDGIRADVAVRVAHRGGGLWVLNSAAIAAVGLERGPEGVERDAAGRVTGRVWRLDGWLGSQVPPHEPDLGALGDRLSSYGITGVTDASPEQSPAATQLLAQAHADGRLPQHLTLLTADTDHALGVGPRKIVVSDHDLPGWDEVVAQVSSARSAGRAVAVHVVTRESLMLVLAVLAEVGSRPGDRIEHAAIADPDTVHTIARLGLAVVTQPSLLATRGDDYLDRVDPDDVGDLWRHGSLLDAGIPVAASSDAPYGDLDPWATVRAARDRVTPSGRTVGAADRVPPVRTLAGFLSSADAPGGPPREVRVGAPADLVLLDAPLPEVLEDPRAERVRLTVIGGRVVHDAEARND